MHLNLLVIYQDNRTSCSDSFASEAVYEMKVDINEDVVADIAYRFTFSPKEDRVQKVTVQRASGKQALLDRSLVCKSTTLR